MNASILQATIITTFGFLILFISFIIVLKRYYRTNNEAQKVLFRSVVEAQENERRIISSNIHDELGGLLTSARMTIAKMKLNNADYKTDPDLEHLNEVIELANLAAKNASNALTPSVISKYGLKGAIEDLPFIYKSSAVKFDIQYSVESNIPEFLQISLFRIISELVNNSIKHSKSNLISIIINVTRYNMLNLMVFDNGIGFNYPSVSDKSNGLINIINRCELLNAKYSIITEVNKGFKFTLQLDVNVQ